jgi:CheY-like chemotaxis protein/DNA-binding XRE family transcriptional regulator
MTMDADVRTNFASAVRWWRKKHGITQEELAERADLHRTYISDVERGARNLSLESISKLATALEVSVATLFGASHIRIQEPGGGTHERMANEFVEILMVEDNPADIELTLQAFKQARFTNKVQVARDGVEALDFLFCRGQFASRNAEEAPHMILLDLNLPRLNGVEVLRRLKSEKRTQDIPVVVLTSSNRDRDIAECRQLGAKVYITKPVSLQRLCEVTPFFQMDWALYRPSPVMHA